MIAITHLELAEFATVRHRGYTLSNRITDELSISSFPHTTSWVLWVSLSGEPGETFAMHADICPAEMPGYPLFFRNSRPATIPASGLVTALVKLGPMTFDEPGRYVVSCRSGSAKSHLILGLHSTPGQ